MSSSNSSVSAGSTSPFDPIYHSILIAIAFTVCISNCLVITLFLTQTHLRSSGNYFLLSLAFSDLAVGVFGIPADLACNLCDLCKSEVKGFFCDAMYAVSRFIAISTVYHILWITLEKYSAIVHPLKHKSQFHRTQVVMFSLCTWFISAMVTAVELAWIDTSGRDHLLYNVFVFTACFIIPVAIMVFAYLSIFLRIFRQRSGILRRHVRPDARDVSLMTRFSPKVKSAMLFFTLLLIFILCWFWWFFFQVYYELTKNYHRFREVLRFVVVFRCCTSFINPILYTFFKRDFKNAVQKLANRSRLTPALHHRSNFTSAVSHSPSEGAVTIISRVSRRYVQTPQTDSST